MVFPAWLATCTHCVPITENNYTQLITDFTTDSRTLIDHLCTNLMDEVINVGVLETYFSDHKAIWASLN